MKTADCLSPNCQLLFRPTREYFTGFYRSSCLFKTGIGLSTAFSETFEEMFPKVSYQKFLAIVVILPAIFANVGLTNIIQFAVPVLMFLYPLAITLMLLVIISPIFKHRRKSIKQRPISH